MALPKQVTVKEDITTLRRYAQKGNELIKKRMRMLIVIKKDTTES